MIYWQGNVLTYFPVPYEDELLYSCIARYAVHTGQANNQKAVVRDVYGSEAAVAVPDLPSHLKNLVDNLRPVWQTKVVDLISNHTMAPYYLPFLSEQQADKITTSMASRAGGNIHTRAGIVASSIHAPNYFRYCPCCVKEQEAALGEPYWRRSHQLPGIEVCTKHNCELVNSAIRFHPKEKHHFHPASLECSGREAKHIDLKKRERRLIEYHAELSASPQLSGLGPYRWTLYYQKLAKDLGLTNKSRVLHQEVYRQVHYAWSNTVFGHFLEGTSENHWLVNIFRKHRKSFHPIRHLLVLVALSPEMSLKEILTNVRKLPVEQASKPSGPMPKKVAHDLTNKHRKEWKILMSDYPEYGVKKLRALSSGGRLYTWLYRNDYQWMMANHPVSARISNQQRKVDYSAWDRVNIEALETMYSQHKKLPNRPRLTRTYLIKLLQRANSVQIHLGDLPQTKKWLDTHAEPLEEYQIFRLRSARQLLIERHQTVKRWRLLRTANIRKELITSRMEHEIQALENSGR